MPAPFMYQALAYLERLCTCLGLHSPERRKVIPMKTIARTACNQYNGIVNMSVTVNYSTVWLEHYVHKINKPSS